MNSQYRLYNLAFGLLQCQYQQKSLPVWVLQMLDGTTLSLVVFLELIIMIIIIILLLSTNGERMDKKLRQPYLLIVFSPSLLSDSQMLDNILVLHRILGMLPISAHLY